MKPSQLDLMRIERGTGANQVNVTYSSGSIIECDLLFIKNHVSKIVKAKFEMVRDIRFVETCQEVNDEVSRQFRAAALN